MNINKMNDSNKLYDDLNMFFKSEKNSFMNHGYFPTSDLIKDKNLDFKNQITLYLSLFDKIKTDGMSILEVGCGRGGGINELSKHFNFKEIYSCDLNEKNIEFCKNNHSKNINFKVCNAEKLDYEDQKFDIVINVESSHLYKDFSSFYKEVKRVLKPNGVFLYTDTGINIHFFPFFFYLFKNIKREDITENVKDACKEDIENFKNINIDEEVKQFMINVSKVKYKEYSLTNNQYIRYTCSDREIM
jgi:ubiquinone/menaquinone biosynthesis C-methylase UbiE